MTADIFKLNDGTGSITTSKYWDCECDEDYITRAIVSECGRCQTIREDQPDSRINEVEAMLVEKVKGFLWESQIAFREGYDKTGDPEFASMARTASILIEELGGLK